MRLFYNRTSPYARKALVAAHELGLIETMTLVETDPWAEPADFLAVTPLSKVPVLVTADGQVVTESDTIVATLDAQGGAGRLLPCDGVARRDVLIRAALCQGLIDASFISVVETRRPAERQWADWIARQRRAVGRTLARMEADFDLRSDRFDMGDIGLACGLAYVAFRLPDLAWRDAHPRLAAWSDRAAARASMIATRP